MSAAAAETAVGPMAIVALDQYERPPLIEDHLARRILPGIGRMTSILGRWGLPRRAVITATEKKIPGLWASMLCRKRYIDEQLLAACATGVDAVVVLGAGLDTRGYRLPLPPRVPVYEVDLPVNIDLKRRRLTKIFGRMPTGVILVPVDFETGDLAEALAAHGYQPGCRTFFVWEAVTQYLTETGVRATLEFLASAASGSRLAFTYVRNDFLDGTDLRGGEAAYQEFVMRRRLWRFGLAPEKVATFLETYGWSELEQAGQLEYVNRYVRPSGRDLPVTDIERVVLAEKA